MNKSLLSPNVTILLCWWHSQKLASRWSAHANCRRIACVRPPVSALFRPDQDFQKLAGVKREKMREVSLKFQQVFGQVFHVLPQIAIAMGVCGRRHGSALYSAFPMPFLSLLAPASDVAICLRKRSL